MLRMENGTVTLEDSLAVSYQTKHTLITQSKNCALWYLTKELKPMSAQLSPHAVFLIVKTWKQSRCPSVGKWEINFGISRQ